MGEQTTVIGTVLSVIFQNEENGYTVLKLVTDDGEYLTVVGCIPCAAPGEALLATGTYTTHASYGEQFEATEVERHLPTEEAEILSYLASGVIRGIGPATAEKIVSRFGADTLEMLECEPEQLTKIKGITDKRAREIGEAFREQMGLRRVMEFLSRYALPTHLGFPLYRRFGAGAAEALHRNPYLLCDGQFGVSFSDSDEIAVSLGMAGDSPLRTEAAILFELFHNEQSGGHVFLPRDKLLDATCALLECGGDAVEKSLDDLIEGGKIVQQQVANVLACYPRARFEEENEVAMRLGAMLSEAPDRLRGAKKVIDEIEREQGITYAPLQRRAVELAAQRKLLLLTGGPGTGKTTCVRAIAELYRRMGRSVILCAPTGRASKRLGELCGLEAQTVHRLIGMSRDGRTGEVVYQKNEKAPLEADAVIVDEMSMVDLSLMRALLAALKPGCRLVLVGDSDQLPSVGAGNVFSDLIRSGRIETVSLQEIFRQAEQSMIVRNAHCVNTGEVPELKNAASGDFFFLPRRDPQRLTDTVVELCKTRLPEKMGIPSDELQVLTPTRKGPAGTAALNLALQAALNPKAPDKRERMWGELVFREGDRVMQTKNDYDVVWEKEDGTAGTGIFNGDVGKILRIDQGGELLTIAFDERVATYTTDMLPELDMAYAMTVHKSQGSEYRGVVLVCAPCAPALEVRGVLYTAITRARELLVLVGDDGTVASMTKNDRRARRYSGLRWRLADGGSK